MFEYIEACPCSMVTDMRESKDILYFLKIYYPEIEFKEKWDNLPPAYLKCTYCIFNSSLKLMRERRYGLRKIGEVEAALNIITNRYLIYKHAEEMIENGDFSCLLCEKCINKK